jgi:dolichyl-diphosphooligosaccharide--protein glycosyltransferase
MRESGRVLDTLADRPDLEDPLEIVLAVDEQAETWTFDDLEIDSGRFGELVSRDIVTAVGDRYRLADPEAVRGALEQHSAEARDSTTSGLLERAELSGSVPDFDRRTGVVVGAAVILVAMLRLVPLSDVYRNGDVVLSGNDPYHYRFLVEQLLQFGHLPGDITTGEPLFAATATLVAEVLGGTATAAGHALAWYPVASAVVTATLVYLLALECTDDRRVALAAVLIFAVVPGHAFRTSFGFGDHHAFDYVWLALTALAVTKLATVDRRTLRSRRTGRLIGVAGLGIAFQVLAWDAGPLLLVPLALLVPVRATLDVLTDRSPLSAGIPLVVALFLGAGIAVTAYLVTGMQSPFIALTPAVLGCWAVFTLSLAAGADRFDWEPRYLVAGYAVFVLVGAVFVLNGPEAVRSTVFRRVFTLFRSDGIFETQSLFSGLEFLYQFGFALLLALPSMVIGLGRSLEDDRWLVLTTYGWVFLLLAAIQVRFSGELAAFVAVFAGYSFVAVAGRLGLLARGLGTGREPLGLPTWRSAAVLMVLFLFVGGYGAIQASAMMDELTVDDEIYGTVSAIAADADERGLDYPENYVLSDWGDNRVYNYFVGGHSLNYTYARENYSRFAGSSNPEEWYLNRFNRSIGYVVLALASDDANQQSTIYRLTRAYGSATSTGSGVGHYRVIRVSEQRHRTAAAVVPGATIVGSAEANASVGVSTDVDVAGASFEYRRRTQVNEFGRWAITVAHPGRYDVRIGNRTTQVTIGESAVNGGGTYTIPSSERPT